VRREVRSIVPKAAEVDDLGDAGALASVATVAAARLSRSLKSDAPSE
jgi:hypothetical protein